MAPDIEVTGGDSSTTTVPVVETVTVPKAEWDETQRRADASSQNFERLKKANETIAEYEARIALLDSNGGSGNGSGDPDPRVDALTKEVQNLSHEAAMAKVLKAYPVLEDKVADFDEFRNKPENQGLSLPLAAKAFVLEKDLLTPQRQGLENATGGGHAAPLTGKLTADQARDLRNTNYKGYVDALKAGRIEVE